MTSLKHEIYNRDSPSFMHRIVQYYISELLTIYPQGQMITSVDSNLYWIVEPLHKPVEEYSKMEFSHRLSNDWNTLQTYSLPH